MSKIDNSFFQRIRFKYKLSVLNENTLEEVWYVRLSKLRVFVFSFLVAILYFFIIAFLIIKTPLRSFLPGYTENVNLRKQVMLDAAKADSLTEAMDIQRQYVTVLSDILSGNVVVDSAATIDLLLIREKDKVNLERTESERHFSAEFEESEKYNISVMDNTQTEMDYLMHSPAKGLVTQKFDEKNKNYGITIVMAPHTNVYSILDGTVLHAGYNMDDNSYILHIQHVDDLISIYKAQQPFFKQKGDQIHAGEILSTFGSDTNPSLSFELWKRGRALNPQDYVTF
jgi:murein DD-endopeptidase MepM/ murein hydrolase activator NlpD